MDDQFATAQKMREALRTRYVSVQELLEWHLKRIKRYNQGINAIVVLTEERAYQRAAEADAALARGVLLGPLHGLPVTIKDCIEVAGMPTTAGVPQRTHTISTTTAPVAQSILDAFCGVYGHRPSETAVPRSGHIPGSPLENPAVSDLSLQLVV